MLSLIVSLSYLLSLLQSLPFHGVLLLCLDLIHQVTKSSCHVIRLGRSVLGSLTLSLLTTCYHIGFSNRNRFSVLA